MYLQDAKIQRSQLVRRFNVRRRKDRLVISRNRTIEWGVLLICPILLTVLAFLLANRSGPVTGTMIGGVLIIVTFPSLVMSAFLLGKGWRLTINTTEGLCVKEVTQLLAVHNAYRYELEGSHFGPHPIRISWQEIEGGKRSSLVEAVITLALLIPFTGALSFFVGEQLKPQIEVHQDFPGIIHYNPKTDIGTVILVFKKQTDCERVLSALAEVLPEQVSIA